MKVLGRVKTCITFLNGFISPKNWIALHNFSIASPDSPGPLGIIQTSLVYPPKQLGSQLEELVCAQKVLIKNKNKFVLTDIKNVDKWSKREASEDKKRKLDVNGEENAPSKKKQLDITGEENASVAKTKKPTLKQSSKKKQPVLLKGQMKMTAFLRV